MRKKKLFLYGSAKEAKGATFRACVFFSLSFRKEPAAKSRSFQTHFGIRAFDTERPLFPTAISLVDDFESTSEPRGAIEAKKNAATALCATPKKKT